MSLKKHHKRRSIIWSLFLCLVGLTTNAQQFDWAQSIGGLGLDVGRAVTTDLDGNVLLVGSFSGSTTLADTFLTGEGSMESFVAKFTSEGELLWARVITGPLEDMARGVVTDNEGSVYVVGHFTDTVTFSVSQGDTAAARSEGGQDVFIAKYRSNGSFVWFLTGGGSDDDTATDIDYYPYSGKFYVSGGFQNRAKFGTATILSSGLTDAFLLKIDGDGNAHWIRKGGGLEHDIASSVAVDQTNESIYITGDFYDQADFDGTAVQAMGSSDMFLAKYDSEGEQQWVRANGGTTVDVATSVGCDLNGMAYISGYYQGTTFFQDLSATALSYNDVFLAQFDAAGNCNWLQSAGSWGLDNCLGMAVAWDGSTYLTGMFEETLHADGLSADGDGYDVFILAYAPSGMPRYIKVAGAGSSDFGMALCLGSDQSLFVTGYYYFFADFDGNTVGAADYGDCFLARLTDILETPKMENQEASTCFKYVPELKVIQVACNEVESWSIYGVSGQLIASGSVLGDQIRLPQMETGLYFVTAKSKNAQFTLRFVAVTE
jgi:hypothetical protein